MSEDGFKINSQSLLAMFPPLIRSSLINDKSFSEYAHFFVAEKVTLPQAGLSFKKEVFYSGVRNALASPENNPVIKDETGGCWAVSIEIESGERYTQLKSDKNTIHLPFFWFLSPDLNARMQEFAREVSEVNFPCEASRIWRERLECGPISENEFDALVEELHTTPVRIAESIHRKIHSSDTSVDEIVPNKLDYFVQLIGRPSNESLASHANGPLREHIAQLLSWDSDIGLKQALTSSSHSLIVANIDVSSFSNEIIDSVFDWVLRNGDFTSKLGAIELGLRNLNLFPQLEARIEILVRQLIQDDPNNDSGRYSLLSALTIMVFGELARTKALDEASPFWVRLASISHASIIERAITSSAASTKEIASWCSQSRGNEYYWKSLLDLREEPRWLPDFLTPSQIRTEFLSRISNTYSVCAKNVSTESLRQLIQGEGGLKSQLEFPYAYFPGALEGNHAPELEMPPEVFLKLKEELGLKSINAGSFASLINSVFIFRIDSAHAELAAQTLKGNKYQLCKVDDEHNLLCLVQGLANVAAVTRSKELGDEVRVLSRVTRRGKIKGFSPEAELRAAIIAAASRINIVEWSDFLGAWITEIAFECQSRDEGAVLLILLRTLRTLQPKLLSTCSRAEATLMSLADSRSS